MSRSKKLCLPLGALAACIAIFAVVPIEQRNEQIKNIGRSNLEFLPDSVHSL